MISTAKRRVSEGWLLWDNVCTVEKRGWRVGERQLMPPVVKAIIAIGSRDRYDQQPGSNEQYEQ